MTGNVTSGNSRVRAERKHFRIGMNKFLLIHTRTENYFCVINFTPSEQVIESYLKGLSH